MSGRDATFFVQATTLDCMHHMAHFAVRKGHDAVYPTRRTWRMQTESSSVASLSCFGWSWAEVTWIFSSIWSIPSVVAYLRGARTNGAMSCGTHVRQRSLLLRQRCFEVTARFYHAICSCGSIIGWKSPRTCCWMQRSACEDSVLN